MSAITTSPENAWPCDWGSCAELTIAGLSLPMETTLLAIGIAIIPALLGWMARPAWKVPAALLALHFLWFVLLYRAWTEAVVTAGQVRTYEFHLPFPALIAMLVSFAVGFAVRATWAKFAGKMTTLDSLYPKAEAPE